MDNLVSIWREACRYIDLNEAVVRMSALVRRTLPAELLLVRRIDVEQGFVETLAVGQGGGIPVPSKYRTACTPECMDTLVEWVSDGKILSLSRKERAGKYGCLLPADVNGASLAAPLITQSGIRGVLILNSRRFDRFEPEHERELLQIMEPFAVALENHHRFHELERLTEAAEAENRALLSRLHRQDIVETIIGAEGSLREVMDRVDQVAPTSAPVLIFGETGSGKEVIARAIHARSSRANGPIVRVNCGAIPPELVDSELFGHEKGSFTGAINTRKGWFERADGGTLFLDEIGELPAAAQVRLLRILQDGSYERVGGQQTLTADVRILAATHRDMESMVREGSFREDLWYRISVFPITLPPLRDRREDLPLLAENFAANAGWRLGGAPLRLNALDMDMLLSYPWPGNVRELAAVIERAAILGGGHRLDIAGAMGTKLDSDAILHVTQHSVPTGPPESLDEAMAQHIKRALIYTNGQIEGRKGAAALLGINPHTLRARMRKLGVEWSNFRRNGSEKEAARTGL